MIEKSIFYIVCAMIFIILVIILFLLALLADVEDIYVIGTSLSLMDLSCLNIALVIILEDT